MGHHLRPLVELRALREPVGTIDRRRLVGDEELALDAVEAAGVLAEQLGLHLLGDPPSVMLRIALHESAPSWW